MDEAAGCLGPIVVALVVIGALLYALGWAFIALAHVFGHAFVLVVLLAGIGAVAGLVRHTRRNPSPAAVADDEYAEFAGVRLLPPEWALRALLVFIGVIAFYGLVII